MASLHIQRPGSKQIRHWVKGRICALMALDNSFANRSMETPGSII